MGRRQVTVKKAGEWIRGCHPRFSDVSEPSRLGRNQSQPAYNVLLVVGGVCHEKKTLFMDLFIHLF